ncbi:MAG: phage tail sheath subtilisin-like domain-containing protein [Gammaproteobacteria bacterium]
MFKNLFHTLRRPLRTTTRSVPAQRLSPARPGDVAITPRTISGADLSAAAFVGLAAQGPLGTAVAISSPAEYAQTFGDHGPGHLGPATRAFFANGGQRLYIVRVAAMPTDTVATQAALASLDGLHDLGLLALPGESTPAILQAAARYCEQRRQVLLLADGPALATVNAATSLAATLHSSHMALYFPWLHTLPDAVAIPPSGAMAGLHARQAQTGQIWKAVAGTTVGVADVTALHTTYDESALASLVQANINPIRAHAGRFVVWGSRTLSTDPEFRYVQVRRFYSYVEASIARGLDWLTHAANTPTTWAAVRQSCADFLDAQWRAGALQGEKPDAAYFVRCDRSSMTQSDLDQGRLIVELGIAVQKPAEFLVLLVAHATADA